MVIEPTLEGLAMLVWRAKRRREDFDALGDDAPIAEEIAAWSAYQEALDEIFEYVGIFSRYDEEAR